MKKKFYMTEIRDYYVPKNKLEEAVQDLLKRENRKLIPSDRVGQYKNNLILELKDLNKYNRRCHPLNPGFFGIGVNRQDFRLDLSCIVFCILECEEL